MGNKSVKPSDEKCQKTKKKKKNLCCCLCPSSLPVDDQSLPPITIDKNSNPTSYYSAAIEDVDNSFRETPLELIIKSNGAFINLIHRFQLNFYLKDYLNRLKTSKIHQTFPSHFSSSTIIYPCNGINQFLTDDLNLFLISPPESILPNLFSNPKSSLKTHEQIRSKCYFIPFTDCQIEPNDDEYRQKSTPLDRTHVVFTLENNPTVESNKISMEFESSWVLISNDFFQTGSIRIDQEKIAKQFCPFIYFCAEENLFYLSSNLIQKWFNTLLLVNQTCAIAKRFLIGDKKHITCLLKEQITNQENSFSLDNNLMFAALRLPPCTYLAESSPTDFHGETSETIIDAFSPTFLSDNRKLFNNYIHIDYEQYSFAFRLTRWPTILIENYYTHPNRYSKRQWPSKSHMNMIIKKPLLLIPNCNHHQWKINFDLIERYLFELMTETTLFLYILCQQFFSQTYSERILIKHCFLNYCEKYGLPFLKHKNKISDVINHFLKDLSAQIKKEFLPNYFNHQKNLLHANKNYQQWFDYIDKCLNDRVYFSSSPTCITLTNRSIIIEFLFDFIDQLYQTFRRKQSEFYLNDLILLDLHQKLSHQTILLEQPILEKIQKNLAYDFESNAELVHICLNQIRKSQTSLIFHYTWTIFIQYLHTYYNVLWNI